MPANLSPLPRDEALSAPADKNDVRQYIEPAWDDWMSAVQTRLQKATSVVAAPLLLDGIQAAVGLTPIAAQNARPGDRYRLSFRIQLIQAATTSSSCSVVVGYASGGVGVLEQSIPLDANIITSVQSGAFYCTPDGPVVGYAINYASVGAAPAIFNVALELEAL